MTNISSAQLEKILEVNAKSIEINLEVNAQYKEIIETLKEIKETNQDIINGNDPGSKRMNETLEKLEEKLLEEHKASEELLNLMVKQTDEIKKSIDRQNLILFGGAASIILGLIGKLLGINVGL
jgi:adenylosuccinate synthase